MSPHTCVKTLSWATSLSRSIRKRGVMFLDLLVHVVIAFREFGRKTTDLHRKCLNLPKNSVENQTF